MAQKQQLARDPQAFRALRSSAINALDGLLAPLVALRGSLDEAADAEELVAGQQAILDAIQAEIASAHADLQVAVAAADAAEERAQAAKHEADERVAAERKRGTEAVARERADRDAEVARIKESTRAESLVKADALKALDLMLAQRRGEVAAAEQALANTRTAHVAFQRAAGIQVGG